MRFSGNPARRRAARAVQSTSVVQTNTASTQTERSHDGPRERLSLFGAARASDADLVAVLLGTGLRGSPVLEVAVRLLERVGGLRGLASVSLSELTEFPGLGPIKASRLVAAFELARRAYERPMERGMAFSSSLDVARVYRARFLGVEVEEVVVVGVDARHRVLSECVVARGGLGSCPATPRDLFAPLLRESASAFVLVHNHPSGDPMPSDDDGRFTERVAQAATLLGLRFLDHVIVGEGGHYSFRDAGRLEKT